MLDKNTILIIDDSKIDRKVLSHVLCNDYSVVEASNGLEAFEIINSQKYDFSLIILDLMMPVMNGFEFLKKHNSFDKLDTPILVVTADENLNNIYKALELGATSILPKPHDTKKLLSKIKETILNGELNHLNRNSYKIEDKIIQGREEYQIDQLTGLYNQTGFLEVAKKVIDKNPLKNYSIIRSDFNRFKLVNEMYGRKVGDKILKDFGRFLVHTLPSSTILARWGADKFIALIDKDRESLKFDIVTIDDYLKEYNIDINLTVLYGVYIVEDRTISIDKMCDRADYSVKRAKNSFGASSYVVYNTSLDKWIKIEQTVVSGIDNAIKTGEIIIYFQPKYSLITQRIVGAEALARWNHPRYGMISPSVFIPILENNGLIHQLDYYVWDQTCAAVARWRKNNLPKIPVSVNVSRNNFYRETLWIELLELIEKHGLKPADINIEITESSYMTNPKLIQSVVDKLQKSGLSVHMDDFGAGVSSLNVLKDLVFDVLKIDLNFLKGLESNDRAAIIVKSIINMNKLLDLPVVAEGIETKAQENFLREIGCEVGQGFLFSKPVDEELFIQLLIKNRDEVNNKYPLY